MGEVGILSNTNKSEFLIKLRIQIISIITVKICCMIINKLKVFDDSCRIHSYERLS